MATYRLPRLALCSISAFLVAVLLASSISCGGGGNPAGTTNPETSSAVSGGSGGLTSAEASKLAWDDAKEAFGDAVLWRLAPVDSRYSTALKLDAGWQDNDRSAAWFVWYADPAGENWLLITITGKEVTDVNIGTRGAAISMSSSWPRQAAAVSMKQAAAASLEGADMDAVTWVEFCCDYEASGYRHKPYWVFACSQTLPNNATLEYRIFVDGITGKVDGALNNRNEDMEIPIDVNALQQTRASDHQDDLLLFFSFLSKGDAASAVQQLAYEASPSDAMDQMWLENFQSIESLSVVSVEPYSLEQWTSERESYKVTLDISCSEPGRYGWENGTNVRWVSIVPQGAGAWKVAELAQNP